LSKIIVSAANYAYFGMLSHLNASIREHDRTVAIGVLDVGLDKDQCAALGKNVQSIIAPGWDYPFVSLPPSHFRAMTARPFLPK
jgi:hypothetical protein